MTNQETHIKSAVISALKEIGVATKKDLKKVETGIRDDMQKMETGIRGDMQKMERRLKRKMGQDRNKIIVTIGRLATSTPSTKKFEQLEKKVERISPSL